MVELENLIEVTDDNFKDKVLDSDLPVIVDYWAEWCPPCRQLKPVFEAVSSQYTGRLTFGKYDTDANRTEEGDPGTRQMEYGVRSIPTLILYHDGKEIHRQVGANATEAWLTELLDGWLKDLN